MSYILVYIIYWYIIYNSSILLITCMCVHLRHTRHAVSARQEATSSESLVSCSKPYDTRRGLSTSVLI